MKSIRTIRHAETYVDFTVCPLCGGETLWPDTHFAYCYEGDLSIRMDFIYKAGMISRRLFKDPDGDIWEIEYKPDGVLHYGEIRHIDATELYNILAEYNQNARALRHRIKSTTNALEELIEEQGWRHE